MKLLLTLLLFGASLGSVCWTKNDCNSCTSEKNCGFCANTFTCLNGTANGPDSQSLPCKGDSWTFDSDSCVVGKSEANSAKIPPEFDVMCKNGGQKHWGDFNPDRKDNWGGSYCDCPENWTGIDCNVCLEDSVCPSAPGRAAHCYRGLVPALETADGEKKQYTCRCSGPHSEICDVLAGNDDIGSFRIAATLNMSANTGTNRGFTAVPQNIPWTRKTGITWASNLTNCVMSTRVACPEGEAYDWEPHEPCLKLHCDAVIWPPGDCDTHHATSWRYRNCISGLEDITTVDFHCQYAQVEGSYKCSFGTDKLGPFALTCETGTCGFNSSSPLPPPPPFEARIPNYVKYGAIFVLPSTLLLVMALCITSIHGKDVSRWRARRLEKQRSILRRASEGDVESLYVNTDRAASPSSGPELTWKSIRTGESRLAMFAFHHVGYLLPKSVVRLSHKHIPLPSPSPVIPSGLNSPSLSAEEEDPVNLPLVSKKMKNMVPVLRDVCGELEPGLTCVLGASGAGKTTLLDILGGRKQHGRGKCVGQIFLNGKRMTASDLRQNVGYLLQDDVLLSTLSPRETLTFHARLKMPWLDDAAVDDRVDGVLKELGLWEVADAAIGDEFRRGLSGGERRRVSIGISLLLAPDLFLADEPTSGLDTASAGAVVESLRAIAHRTGRPVIISIHQPRSDIFQLFDSIILLSQEGQCIFSGTKEEALEFFAHCGHAVPSGYNPADYFLDSLSKSVLRERYDMSQAFKNMFGKEIGVRLSQHEETFSVKDATRFVSADLASHCFRHAPSVSHPLPWQLRAPYESRSALQSTFSLKEAPKIAKMSAAGQFRLLLVRTCLHSARNPNLLLLHVIATAAVGLIVGSAFYDAPYDWAGIQNRSGVCFFTLAFFAISSLSALSIWSTERLLFIRERASGAYSTLPFFLAKVMGDLVPLRIFPPIIYAAVVYWLVGLHPTPTACAYFLALLMLTSVAATSLCFAVGTICRSTGVANLVASMLLLFCLLLSGFLLQKDSVGAIYSSLQRLSFLNYAFESLMINEFYHQDFLFDPRGFRHVKVPVQGKEVLLQLGFYPSDFHGDILYLAGLTAGFLVLAYGLLRWGVKERR